MDTQKLVAGIDVAKAHIDLCIGRDGNVVRCERTKKDLKRAVALVRKAGVTLVVMESTGPFSALVVDAFWAAEIPVSVANAHRCKLFAESLGQIEKTDSLDARSLVRFGEVTDPRPLVPPCADRRLLRELHARRRHLVEMRVKEKQRIEFAPSSVRASHREMIRFIERNIAKLDTRIEQAIRDAAEPIRELAKCFVSISGIATVTAAALIARMPELGQIDRREVAKLVGVAPLCNDSGSRFGPRRIKGGRSDVRVSLYMPTLNAMAHNPQIRAFNERLKAKGKPGKVRIIACMRKLLTILNAVARDRVMWDPTLFKNPPLETAA